ncbi:YrhK family protein [Pseudodonghicola flavimaris]|uniref:YrhK family protein n=1 Tax=Pseudodonghicola flavimaris TaxID=3050036 RepID=A0ABT7EYI6_9RHOB|nr:YrhK family protein [Pseudodonghicola flavimaris]MDK3017354.1 YrhK family protein [Pseudodonghicola flavimaris]
MPLFFRDRGGADPQSDRVYAAYEIAHTVVDFLAAISFLVGSILFFYAAYQVPATWLFVIGSAFFCLKPTLRLAREIHLWRVGSVEALAKRAEETR